MIKPQFKAHHHYKGNFLTPAEQVERKVVELILRSKVPDSKREDSIVFELKHSSGCVQFARVLAQKRNLNIEIAEVAAVLHDIYVIKTGHYKNHAILGVPIAEKILKKISGFSDKEIKIITQSVAHHSEKDIYTDDPYIELIKDVDVLDCSLYKGAEGDYRVNKTEIIINEYIKRIKSVRKEIGLNPDQVWRE